MGNKRKKNNDFTKEAQFKAQDVHHSYSEIFVEPIGKGDKFAPKILPREDDKND